MSAQLFTKLFTSSYTAQISEVSTASKFVTVPYQVCLLEASETHISVCICMPLVRVNTSTQNISKHLRTKHYRNETQLKSKSISPCSKDGLILVMEDGKFSRLQLREFFGPQEGEETSDKEENQNENKKRHQRILRPSTAAERMPQSRVFSYAEASPLSPPNPIPLHSLQHPLDPAPV